MRAILTYHSIDGSGSVISTDPTLFRRQIEALVAHGVQVVPLDTVPELPAGADAVAVTFDDGFKNFGSMAWPVLRDHNLPVTLFVVTGHVGETNSWDHLGHESVPELPLLDWDELARLAEEGVDLGSHTSSHADLPSLSDDILAQEVNASADRLSERTGTPPRSFAYPFGRSSSRVATAASRAYELACTTDLRPLGNREDVFSLPRIDMYYLRRPSTFRRWGTTSLHSYLQLRRQIRHLRGRIGRAALHE
jgi:peptidoglycan/xylan/chitin deacetylase (PgdA/CDA1 family)